ncbi:MAG: transposase, partial [Muribaculaceae bacterium]|nr:transposase [Muribaculaceae bacterium]
DAMMLRAVQTLNSTELEGKKITLNQWYLSVLKTYRTDLLKITSLLVADAAFSVLPFV